MDASSSSKLPLNWLQLLENLRTVSKRCNERFAELHNRFPDVLPEIPTVDAEPSKSLISPERRRSHRYRRR